MFKEKICTTSLDKLFFEHFNLCLYPTAKCNLLKNNMKIILIIIQFQLFMCIINFKSTIYHSINTIIKCTLIIFIKRLLDLKHKTIVLYVLDFYIGFLIHVYTCILITNNVLVLKYI